MKLGSPPEYRERGWPLQFDFLENPPAAFSLPASFLAVALFIVATIVAVIALGWLLVDLMSGDQKRAADATKTALPILAGAIGLPLIIWRLRILDRQTRISEEKTQIDRETHYTSIFSRGIDQLGQTREIKRTVDSIDTTKTVPNIEVRLGGIHSLARLAEESLRDREKIKNILRSYIRENSWSDRIGEIIEKPNWPRNSVLDWAYELDFDPSDSDAQAKRNDWTTKTKDLLSRFEKWAAQVPETRVDVNESVDALSVVPPADAAEARAFFYECLFVGRHFGRSLLSLLNFRRCTFIRCTFDASEHHFELNDCYFFSTRFQGSNANIAILNSRLLNVSINAQQGSEIALRHCEVHSSRFAGTLTHLKLTDCTLHRIVVSGVRRDDGSLPIATIDFNDSVLVNSTLRRFALSSESDLHFAASPDIAFNEVDLAAVTNLDSRMLHAVKADAKTIHPIKAERPASWPKYDAKDDDDIPF